MNTARNFYHRPTETTFARRRARHHIGSREGSEAGDGMEIADWRNKIDELDEQIVALLCERAAAAIEIGKLKAQAASPVYEPKREQVVYDRARAKAASRQPESLSGTQIQDIYERIMDVMRSLQKPADTAQAGEDKRHPQQPYIPRQNQR
ncbi:Chorismate mutase [Bryocella elongata]|uniref:chorismate mutase n=1 Tax=Bryocella elongata TaxID=863522 RepID=A0A1H6A8P3_9BACT|nr:Chorismate mutase [Bryocella elongata]